MSDDRPLELLDRARQAGAEVAEVYQTRDYSRPVFFEANRLKQLETNASEGIALRLWKNGCPGLAVAYGPIEASAIVERAIALAALNPPEEIDLTPPRRDRPTALGPAEIPVEDLVELGNEAISGIHDRYPEAICGGDFEWERQTTRLVNSYGLDCQYEDASLSASLGVEWVRGDDFLGIYDGETTRAAAIDREGLIAGMLQCLAWSQTNVTAPSGQLPVLFTDKAADLLWGIVAAALNGKRVAEGASPWSERRGQIVAIEGLSLSQKPDLGPASCPFDDEGVPTGPLALIDRGRVENFYCDRSIGRQLGTGTTGNGFRPGLSRYPTPSLTNLIVSPGNGGTLADLLAGLDRAIVVDQTLGGGPDLSGEFSLNIDLGYYVEGGQVRGRVKDTMVAGNAYAALQNILALGSDRRWQGSCLTPAVLVAGLSVVG